MSAGAPKNARIARAAFVLLAIAGAFACARPKRSALYDGYCTPPQCSFRIEVTIGDADAGLASHADLPELTPPAALPPRGPENDDVRTQRARYDSALVAHQNGDLAVAERALVQLYADGATPRVLFALGRVRYERQDYPGAVAALRVALATTQDKTTAESRQREDARRMLADADRQTSWIGITCDEPGTVMIDDTVELSCPLRGRLRVRPGRRLVAAQRRADRCSSRQVVELAPGAFVMIQELRAR